MTSLDKISELLKMKCLKGSQITLLRYGYYNWNDELKKLEVNPEWHEPNFDAIKKIGVTGSHGKTSTCEYLYSYLRAKNKGCLLLCTNGIFVNDTTILKDKIDGNYEKTLTSDILYALCGLYDVEYIIIELIGELFLASETYLPIDITAFTMFDEEEIAHFGTVENYIECKNRALKCGQISLVSNKYSDTFYHTATFDLINNYKDFNKYQVENLSVAVAVLKQLNIYDETFEFPTLVRGRFDTFENGRIIIDTGWGGLNNLLPLYEGKKLKLLFVPILRPQAKLNENVLTYLNTVKDVMNNFEKIYFVIPKAAYQRLDIDLSRDYLLPLYLPENYTNVDYIFNYKEAFEKAYSELADDETLLILCRDNFRAFRDIVRGENISNLSPDQYHIGAELEFNCDNIDNLLKTFKENNIDYEWVDVRTPANEKLTLKTEKSVDGYEICFPPSYDKTELILSLMESQCYFTERCTLHIHVSNYNKINTNSLETIYNYYRENEGYIIQEIADKDLFLNLNFWSREINNNIDKYNIRKQNLNIFGAYRLHRTIEHRVYKATFNYEDFIWCINNTLNIIKTALNDNNENETTD